MLEQYDLSSIFEMIEPLLLDADKYKQRAGAEIWAGFMRGKFFGTILSVVGLLIQHRLQALATGQEVKTLEMDSGTT